MRKKRKFKMLTLKYALAAINAQKNATFTASKLTSLLANCTTTATIANVTQVTQVQTSAANKHITIHKVTRASVLLFANAINYTAIIKRNAAKHAQNDVANVNAFTASTSSFTHNANCYSLVTNNNSTQQYLYAHYNSAQSVYVLNNAIISTAQAAEYCTASVQKTMLQNSSTQHNASNNITHNIVVRTVKLQNVVRLAALKQVLI
jgi:hypothetical protein